MQKKTRACVNSSCLCGFKTQVLSAYTCWSCKQQTHTGNTATCRRHMKGQVSLSVCCVHVGFCLQHLLNDSWKACKPTTRLCRRNQTCHLRWHVLRSKPLQRLHFCDWEPHTGAAKLDMMADVAMVKAGQQSSWEADPRASGHSAIAAGEFRWQKRCSSFGLAAGTWRPCFRHAHIGLEDHTTISEFNLPTTWVANMGWRSTWNHLGFNFTPCATMLISRSLLNFSQSVEPRKGETWICLEKVS